MRLDDVTLYVPARNAEATLPACLAAARALDPAPARILVVVDPGSRDRTVEIARATAGVETIEQDATGLPAARNLAFAEARTEWVASIDADVSVAPDWLGALWSARARFPEAAAIAGRTEERVLGLADAWRALMMPHHWGAHPVDGPFMIVSEAIFRREAVVSVGGYRETLVRYGDDSRLCRDLRDAGHRLAYTPAARALHERHDDLASILDLRWDYAAPRQAHRLDDLEGLAGKLTVNAEYGRLAVLRALAAGEPLLALVGAMLPLHHAVRDVAALCAGRALLPASARASAARRIAGLARAAAAPSGVIAEVARTVLGDADVRAPGLAWRTWDWFERAVVDALASWIAECAPLVRGADAATFASPSFDDRRRWAALLGGPDDPSRPGAQWPRARSVTPWPARPDPGHPASPRATTLPAEIAAMLAGRHVVTLAPAGSGVVPRAGSFTIASSVTELAEIAGDALVLPALDAWPAPRVILSAARRAQTVVVGARGPSALSPDREPVLAADLAEAVAAAGLRIRSFETLAGESFLWAERAPLSS